MDNRSKVFALPENGNLDRAIEIEFKRRRTDAGAISIPTYQYPFIQIEPLLADVSALLARCSSYRDAIHELLSRAYRDYTEAKVGHHTAGGEPIVATLYQDWLHALKDLGGTDELFNRYSQYKTLLVLDYLEALDKAFCVWLGVRKIFGLKLDQPPVPQDPSDENEEGFTKDPCYLERLISWTVSMVRQLEIECLSDYTITINISLFFKGSHQTKPILNTTVFKSELATGKRDFSLQLDEIFNKFQRVRLRSLAAYFIAGSEDDQRKLAATQPQIGVRLTGPKQSFAITPVISATVQPAQLFLNLHEHTTNPIIEEVGGRTLYNVDPSEDDWTMTLSDNIMQWYGGSTVARLFEGSKDFDIVLQLNCVVQDADTRE